MMPNAEICRKLLQFREECCIMNRRALVRQEKDYEEDSL